MRWAGLRRCRSYCRSAVGGSAASASAATSAIASLIASQAPPSEVRRHRVCCVADECHSIGDERWRRGMQVVDRVAQHIVGLCCGQDGRDRFAPTGVLRPHVGEGTWLVLGRRQRGVEVRPARFHRGVPEQPPVAPRLAVVRCLESDAAAPADHPAVPRAVRSPKNALRTPLRRPSAPTSTSAVANASRKAGASAVTPVRISIPSAAATSRFISRRREMSRTAGIRFEPSGMRSRERPSDR